MLFVTLLTLKDGLTRQQIDDASQRRARWKYPSDITLVGEYWIPGTPNVICVFEAESVAPIIQVNHAWADVFDAQTHPAVTGDDGLRVLQQAGVVRRRGRRPKYLRV